MSYAARDRGNYDWSRLQPVVGELAHVSSPFAVRPDSRLTPPMPARGVVLLTATGLALALQVLGLIRPPNTSFFGTRFQGTEIGFILVGIILALRSLYLWAARLSVDPSYLTYTMLPGIRRRIPRALVAGMVLRLVDTSTAYAPMTRSKRLLLIDGDGRCIFRMDAKYFEYSDAFHLAAALQVPIDAAWDYPVERQALRSEIPGAVYWPELHVTMLSFLGCIVAIAVLSTGALLLQGPSHP